MTGSPRIPAASAPQAGRPRWRLVGGAALLGHSHSGRGGLDESARRLGHEELAVATTLADEGHDVVSLRDGFGRGPIVDLAVRAAGPSRSSPGCRWTSATEGCLVRGRFSTS